MAGFETNKKWKNSLIPERVPNPALENGELNPRDFGKWTKFAR